MNGEKIKRLQKEFNISDEKLIELGMLPQKKKLIQGNVTESEKKKLKELIFYYNQRNEKVVDASKMIREVIDQIIDSKSIYILESCIRKVKEDCSLLDKKVNVLIENDKLIQLIQICKDSGTNVSNIIRCCVVYIIQNKYKGES